MRYAEEALKKRDFLPRRRIPTIIQFLAIFSGLYALMLLGYTLAGSAVSFLVWSFVLTGITAAFVTLNVQRSRDLMLATEFQNSIFTAALSVDNAFYLIMREDGSILHQDSGVQRMFPHFYRLTQRTLSSFLEMGRVSREDCDAVFSAVEASIAEPQVTRRAVFNLRDASNQPVRSLHLTVNCLTRPGNFVLLCGRDYVAERHSDKPAKEISCHSVQDSWELIANSPIATVHISDEGTVISVNNAFHALTQQTFLNHLPRTLAELAPSGKHADAEALSARLLAGDLPLVPQLIDVALPGNQHATVSMYASRVENGIVLYLIDVTEQKNLELRFAHSQKMQAVGQLAGGVAHDFNNLLTAMIGFCDLLLMRHPAGDQSFADIMQIKQNANRAANLVRQLLAFSRRQTLQPKTLDITDVLAELSNLVRRLIGENIELKMIHGRDLGLVKVDQGQLEQVVINLAVNARDAMNGGGVLTIRTSAVNIQSRGGLPTGLISPADEDSAIPPGKYVLVEVTDTGSGIPKEIIQKIFEPFFSTKEVGSGTGLGLSTVYGIIKQTGGYLYVSSREGQGSTFYIYFPSHQSSGVVPALESESGDKTIADLTGRGTLLLVEDETPVRIFACRALRNKGYTVLEADCGETGLEIMLKRGAEVDLIVTDVIMPGMNGPAMIEKIMEDFPNIKVIFISGYAEDIFMHSYGSERSFNFLAKPFTLKQLASKVKEVLVGK